MSLDSFIALNKELLKIEHEAELEETQNNLTSKSAKQLQIDGIAILKLQVDEISTTLGARTLVKFCRPYNLELPGTKLSNGDIVGVFNNFSEPPICTGIVDSVKTMEISVVLDDQYSDLTDFSSNTYNIALIGSNVTYSRYMETLKILPKHQSNIIDVAFNGSQPSRNNSYDRYSLSTDNLNESQMEASRHVFSSNDISLILGPPGCGKTVTLVEIIRAIVQAEPEAKILVCAPSNAAVDNIAEKFIDTSKSIDVVRMGHPSRLSETIESVSLSSKVDASDEAQLCSDIKAELKAARISVEKKRLRKELKIRQNQAIDRVMGKARVIFSTLVGASKVKTKVDYVIIDEAAQALEIACWIPIVTACPRKLVLAGDHKQLAATIKSKEAEERGLGITLFSRLYELHGNSICSLLNIQYRMNQEIMKWSSMEFYDDKLIAHESVKNRTLQSIDTNDMLEDGMLFYSREDLLVIPLLFVTTRNEADFEEAYSVDGSHSNPGESALIKCYLEILNKSGITDICVISPYSAQVELIRQDIRELSPLTPVSTVDSFQGRECSVVLISLVRSNRKAEIGFLKDPRRINVAITRAKMQCVIFGNSDTVGQSDSTFRSLVKYAKDLGRLVEVGEFADLEKLQITKVSNAEKEIVQAVTSRQSKSVSVRTEKVKPLRETPKLIKEVVRIEPSPAKNPSSFTADKIHEILTSIEDSYEFPSSLSASERRLVHELAEQLNFSHESIGEGENRRIVVQKLPTRSVQTEIKPASEDPKLNIPAKKLSKPVKPPKMKDLGTIADDFDFDSLVDNFAEESKKCSNSSCKTVVSTFGIVCTFCRKKYCYSHIQAEVHGCGEAASKHAKQSKPRPSSSDFSKSKINRSEAESRLHEKIKSAKNSRSSKQPS
jgi:ATP-dependent RNA/DNA helicase IGHMBP2